MILMIAATAAASGGEAWSVPVPSGDEIAKRLAGQGPRLYLTDARLAALEKRAESDVDLARIRKQVLASAEAELRSRKKLEHKLKGPRLLYVSRRALKRIMTLSLAYRLTGERKYAAGATRALEAVCAFPDWNPSHFLDVAEMSNAVGIGYDWLGDALEAETRKRVRRALIAKGLKPALHCYAKPQWWTRSDHNWNQVCNGGILTGALAIAGDEPQWTAKILPRAVKSLPLALRSYGPDGAWGEGPSYWHYATRYTCYALSALRTALGTDFGLSEAPGLRDTARFPIQTTGPTGLRFNFADSGDRSRRGPMPCMFWLARRFEMPEVAASEHALLEDHDARAMHFVWYAPRPAKDARPLARDAKFGGQVPVAVMRSGWEADALWVGVKGGDNQVNHGHLDLGQFELDALGVRWVRDLGKDYYNLPGYWSRGPRGKRWSYFRLNSLSHSVPLINGRWQKVAAVAPIEAFRSGRQPLAIVDLTAAYPYTDSARRGVRMLAGRRAVLVQDEFTLTRKATLSWQILTDAKAKIDGDTVRLEREGKAMKLVAVERGEAEWKIVSAEQKKPEARNKGVKRVMLTLEAPKGAQRFAVLFVPQDGREVATPTIRPLNRWSGQ